uniref:Uncharacterized protein n=1 Tax=Magallana gigas TaxID=29159 RepID=A0A8W8L302_MAGGI
MDIVPFILWNHLVKNCQTFENLAVLPRILWYAWQAIPPSPRGHFRSTCYIELTPTDVRGDQVMGSFEISLEDYCRIKIEDFHSATFQCLLIVTEKLLAVYCSSQSMVQAKNLYLSKSK